MASSSWRVPSQSSFIGAAHTRCDPAGDGFQPRSEHVELEHASTFTGSLTTVGSTVGTSVGSGLGGGVGCGTGKGVGCGVGSGVGVYVGSGVGVSVGCGVGSGVGV